MEVGKGRSRRGLFRIAAFGLLAATLGSCTALPGGSLDPLAPALGLPRQEGQVQPRDEWTGQYRDSRGEGKITLSLTREGNALQGAWPFSPEVSGKFAGALAPDGRSLTFTIGGADRGCAAALTGHGEYLGDQIHATYTGTDCKGAITWGYLELKRK